MSIIPDSSSQDARLALLHDRHQHLIAGSGSHPNRYAPPVAVLEAIRASTRYKPTPPDASPLNKSSASTQDDRLAGLRNGWRRSPIVSRRSSAQSLPGPSAAGFRADGEKIVRLLYDPGGLEPPSNRLAPHAWIRFLQSLIQQLGRCVRGQRRQPPALRSR